MCLHTEYLIEHGELLKEDALVRISPPSVLNIYIDQ
jgi:hypothetical protein